MNKSTVTYLEVDCAEQIRFIYINFTLSYIHQSIVI